MNQDQEQKNKLCELYVGQSFIGTKKAWEEHKKESQKSEESKTRFLDVKPCVSQATKDLSWGSDKSSEHSLVCEEHYKIVKGVIE